VGGLGQFAAKDLMPLMLAHAGRLKNSERSVDSDYLLVSDLDDTFLGDREALDRFAAFYEDVRDSLTIAYASGRFYDSIREDILSTSLPAPVAILGGVGSEIRNYPGGDRDEEWTRQISNNWSAARVRELLGGDNALQLQPAASQSDHKVSYYFENATEAQLDQLKSFLAEHGIAVDLVYSSGRDLDILPKGVNKGTAAVFIADRLGYPPNRVMVSGNSGNDLRLFEHGFLGILVANAHRDLKEGVGEDVYQSSKKMADGVRDGITHWMKPIVRTVQQ